MSKWSTLLLFLIYLSYSYSQETTKKSIKFNGIYETRTDNISNTKIFLRFYPNGKVVHVNCISTVTINDAKNWLTIERSELDEIGNYKLNKNLITYVIDNDFPIEWEGKVVENDVLLLHYKNSLKNKKGEDIAFYFVKINDLK